VVDLTWATASEYNNDRFEIERSTNGLNWSQIGSVSGMGTTQQRHEYLFTDEYPENGENYYRLKQVDFDDKYEYSPIRLVTFGSEITPDNSRIVWYPNPTSGQI